LGILLNRYVLGYVLAPDGKIEEPLSNVIIVSGQLALLGLGVYLLKTRPRISLTNLLLTVSSALFATLLGGVILQFFYSPPPVTFGWRFTGSKFEKNQLGFRGQPIAYSQEDYVILLLGDSMVQAAACVFGWMPEHRLEHHLRAFGKRAKVFSIGAGGYGQDQQLLVLKEYYRRFRADLVVLWQVPENDIWNNMFPTHWPANGRLKPTFWLKHGELYGPTGQMDEKAPTPTPTIKLIALLQNTCCKWRGYVDWDEEWERNLPPPYTPLTEYNGPANYSWQKRWDLDFGDMRNENLANEKSHLALYLTPRSQRMEYGLALTRKLLQEIAKLVQSQHGKFLIFNYTTPPRDYSIGAEEVYALNGKYYKTSKLQKESNINYINAGFESIIVAVTVPDWRVGPEDGHLNQHAVDQTMRGLANDLKSFIPDKKE
jgi:hypothetical protein